MGRRVGIAHVALEGQHLGAEAPQLIGDLLEARRFRQVDGGHARPLVLRAGVARQAQACCPSDTARRSRHQDAHVEPRRRASRSRPRFARRPDRHLAHARTDGPMLPSST
jgi:hypothetical protein